MIADAVPDATHTSSWSASVPDVATASTTASTNVHLFSNTFAQFPSNRTAQRRFPRSLRARQGHIPQAPPAPLLCRRLARLDSTARQEDALRRAHECKLTAPFSIRPYALGPDGIAFGLAARSEYGSFMPLLHVRFLHVHISCCSVAKFAS